MAVRLSDHFTFKKLLKAVVAPILMMVFTSIYSIIDGLFVSNFVGDSAFAGLNIIFPFTMIIGAIGFMFGAGGSALVSMKLGEGKREEANQIFAGIVYFTVILGAIISVICFFFVEEIAVLLGATPEMLPHAVVYGKILIAGEVAFMTQNLFQVFCMVAERPNLGFALSIIAGLVNMGLDALLIVGFDMGIAGAGVATIAAQVIASLVAIIYFARKNKSLLRLAKPSFHIKNILQAMTNGASEFLGNVASSVVGILFNLQLLKYAGESGVIAYGVLMYLGFIFNAIYIGYAIGTAPMIGYHYGAENHKELKNILKKSLILNVMTGFLMTLFSILLAQPLSSIFVGYDAELLTFTTNAMRIFSFAFIFSGLNIFTSSFFTALNNGWLSAVVAMSRTLIFQIACVFVLPLFWGVNGIWLALIVAEMLALVVCVIALFSNKKKYQY